VHDLLAKSLGASLGCQHHFFRSFGVILGDGLHLSEGFARLSDGIFGESLDVFGNTGILGGCEHILGLAGELFVHD